MKRFLLLISLLLLACEDESSENCPTPTSGAFTKVQLRGTITKDSINSLRADFGIEHKYEAVTCRSLLEYETLGPKGEEIIASGAVYIPIKEDNEPMSLISGQHGLTIKKYDVPSVIPSYGYFDFSEQRSVMQLYNRTMGLGTQIILFIRSVKKQMVELWWIWRME